MRREERKRKLHGTSKLEFWRGKRERETKRQNKEDEKLEGKLGVMVIFFVILFVKFTLSLSF